MMEEVGRREKGGSEKWEILNEKKKKVKKKKIQSDKGQDGKM